MSKVNVTRILAGMTLGVAIAVPTMLPTNAMAQTSHRQKSKNTWRNLGYAGGALGIYGLLSHNSTLTWLGLGGGAYSAYRYEQDRKSQRREQDRYARYRRGQSFYRPRYRSDAWHHDNGRHLGWYKNGKAYGRHHH